MNNGNTRVGTPTQVAIITKYTFLNYFRARRFYVLLAIVVLVGGAFTAAAAYYRPPFFGFGMAALQDQQLTWFSSFWGSFATLMILLSVSFFGGDAISGEVQNKTGYFLVPNPVRRSALYTGKWLAALAASTIMLVVFALIALADGAYFFGTPIPNEFFESVLFAWINLVAVLGLAFMFSSLFKSSAISILMTVIILVFVFRVVDTIVASVAGIEPWFSITYAGNIISDILTVPYPTTTTVPTPGFKITLFVPTVPEGLAIMAAYFVLTAIAGLYLFERREFT